MSNRRTNIMYTPDQPLTPPEEEERDWYAIKVGDDDFNYALFNKVDAMLGNAVLDEDSHDRLAATLDALYYSNELTHDQLDEMRIYLTPLQRSVPYSQVKNPTQQQIPAFIRKVANL